jgi:hypothetical protein
VSESRREARTAGLEDIEGSVEMEAAVTVPAPWWMTAMGCR